jgi:hypothetical protein
LLAAQVLDQPEGRYGRALRTDSHFFSVGSFPFVFHLWLDRDGWIIIGAITAAKIARRRESSLKPGRDWPVNADHRWREPATTG